MDSFIFNCLVIEDEDEFKPRIKYIEQMLLEDFNCHVKFDFMDKIEKDKYLDGYYDLLLIDFNLSRKSSENGDEIIKNIRKKNKIIKIIFYSSQFLYDQHTKTFKFDEFSDHTIFKLINEFNVNKIVPREELDFIVNAIYECCKDFDLTLLSLYKTVEKYYNSGINVNYTLPNNTIITNNKLLEEIKSDSDISKKIRNKIIDFSINNVFDFEY